MKETLEYKILKHLSINNNGRFVDISEIESALKEFPKTKWFARIGLLIAVVLALKELYIWLVQSPSQ